MLVLPDNTEPVIDNRGSCVPHCLDSIVLDRRSVMEAGGDLKRAKRVLFSSGLMYSHTESRYILLSFPGFITENWCYTV